MKLARPLIKACDTSVARVPAKQADPHYLSTDWKATRRIIFARDRHTCTVPGCGKRALVCEHIKTRRFGGTDAHDNLTSLCRDHDNHFKELGDGTRRNAEEWQKIFAPKG